jgi:hypothetical protein
MIIRIQKPRAPAWQNPGEISFRKGPFRAIFVKVGRKQGRSWPSVMGASASLSLPTRLHVRRAHLSGVKSPPTYRCCSSSFWNVHAHPSADSALKGSPTGKGSNLYSESAQTLTLSLFLFNSEIGCCLSPDLTWWLGFGNGGAQVNCKLCLFLLPSVFSK